MVTMIIKDGDNALMMANYERVVGQTFVCAALINSRGGHLASSTYHANGTSTPGPRYYTSVSSLFLTTGRELFIIMYPFSFLVSSVYLLCITNLPR